MNECVFAAFLSFDASTANLDIGSQRRLVSALWVSGIRGLLRVCESESALGVDALGHC